MLELKCPHTHNPFQRPRTKKKKKKGEKKGFHLEKGDVFLTPLTVPERWFGEVDFFLMMVTTAVYDAIMFLAVCAVSYTHLRAHETG